MPVIVMVPDPTVAFAGAFTKTVAEDVVGIVSDAGKVTVTPFPALAESETVPEKLPMVAKFKVSWAVFPPCCTETLVVWEVIEKLLGVAGGGVGGRTVIAMV